MKHFELSGKLRTTGRKADVNSIRREGRVPCVVYGNGTENISFSIDAKDLKGITCSPNSFIIDLDIEGKKMEAVFHAVQYHPVTDEALHVDFLAVSEDKPITISVPVIITGNSEGVKLGGKLATGVRKLKISGLMKDLPDDVTVDITNLQLGKQISAGDIKIENIKVISPKTTLICAVRMTRSAAAATEAAE